MEGDAEVALPHRGVDAPPQPTVHQLLHGLRAPPPVVEGQDGAQPVRVQQAAQGTQQVSSNITDVQRGATETGTASSQVLSAAQMLSNDSGRLKNEVSRFLTNVRAA